MQNPSSVLSPREVINREDEDIARAISMSLEVGIDRYFICYIRCRQCLTLSSMALRWKSMRVCCETN